MTFQRNIIDFTQPHEPAAQKGRPAHVEREYAIACENMQKARKAGVPMMTGTDSRASRSRPTANGTRWSWRSSSATWASLLPRRCVAPPRSPRSSSTMATAFGVLAPGGFADFIAVEGSPLENIAILQDKTRIRHVHIAGKRMQIPDRSYDPRQVTDRSLDELDRPLHAGARTRTLSRAAAARRGGGVADRPPAQVKVAGRVI